MKTFYSLLLLFGITNCFGQFIPEGKIHGRDSCDFSSDCSIVKFNQSTENTWTIGKPSKMILNNGRADSFAIFTDTLQYYSNNSKSSFIVSNLTSDFNYTDVNFMVSFWHKLNSDYGHDGGYIEVSFDSGETWVNAVSDTVRFINYGSKNMYKDTQLLYNNQPGFSGDIMEWTLVEIPIQRYQFAKRSENTLVRFTFVSDSITNEKEGWLIDDIKLSEIELYGGLNSLNKASQLFTISPNPCQNIIEINALEGNLSGLVSVYSIEGKKLKEFKLNRATHQQFELNELSAGMYSIIFQNQDGVSYYQKLMKTE